VHNQNTRHSDYLTININKIKHSEILYNFLLSRIGISHRPELVLYSPSQHNIYTITSFIQCQNYLTECHNLLTVEDINQGLLSRHILNVQNADSRLVGLLQINSVNQLHRGEPTLLHIQIGGNLNVQYHTPLFSLITVTPTSFSYALVNNDSRKHTLMRTRVHVRTHTHTHTHTQNTHQIS
jgi:hypothetical protein